jgi:hypothetical protein
MNFERNNLTKSQKSFFTLSHTNNIVVVILSITVDSIVMMMRKLSCFNMKIIENLCFIHVINFHTFNLIFLKFFCQVRMCLQHFNHKFTPICLNLSIYLSFAVRHNSIYLYYLSKICYRFIISYY